MEKHEVDSYGVDDDDDWNYEPSEKVRMNKQYFETNRVRQGEKGRNKD